MVVNELFYGHCKFYFVSMKEMKESEPKSPKDEEWGESGKCVRTIVHTHSGTYIRMREKARWSHKSYLYKCNTFDADRGNMQACIHTERERELYGQSIKNRI